MAKKTFKGRPILPGKLEGKALVSKLPFNLTGSYFENMFAGNTKTAPCTDANNPELFRKDMKGAIYVHLAVHRVNDGRGCTHGGERNGRGPQGLSVLQRTSTASQPGD